MTDEELKEDVEHLRSDIALLFRRDELTQAALREHRIQIEILRKSNPCRLTTKDWYPVPIAPTPE